MSLHNAIFDNNIELLEKRIQNHTTSDYDSDSDADEYGIYTDSEGWYFENGDRVYDTFIDES